MRTTAPDTCLAERLVRKAQPDDWAYIRELCCRTGNAGEPIAPERWPFFSEQWVGPYERLIPEWTYVATLGGRRMGYLTGCKDTRAFEVKRHLWFELPLALRLRLMRAFPRSGETERYIRRALGLEKGPNDLFLSDFLSSLQEDYPAHLHVNVDALARGTGLGRELIDTYRADLVREGVRGIHLFCGEKPVRFYEKTGFSVLATLEIKPGVNVFCMGSLF